LLLAHSDADSAKKKQAQQTPGKITIAAAFGLSPLEAEETKIDSAT
jgi:hypothetical protein